jgi:4-amino-4-deoxy-L-arabinose transferase-like glycosyltransferase
MKRANLLALILIFASMVAAARVSSHTFDRLPHLEDEFAYLFQARIFQEGDVYIELPQPNRAYWQPFLINLDNKRFSKYPPGWSLLLAVGTATNAPWIVNFWMAGLTVALTYRIGRELYDETAGVVAALLMTISPIALLLNATLMAHTSTLFLVLLFIYSMWRLERGKKLWLWGTSAGIALGLAIASRPLTGVAIAVPMIVYCVLRLLWLLIGNRAKFLSALRPLIALSVMAIAFGALYPAYNYIVAGSPTQNLYKYIWSYDTIGFGPDHGRHSGRDQLNILQGGIKVHMRTYEGHSLARGWNILKRDGKCYSRDLFGWVMQPDNPPEEIATGNECLVDKLGLSWILLPLSLLFPLMTAIRKRNKSRVLLEYKWTLLVGILAAAIIGINVLYWIGAGVYSARYFFEATGLLAILSGAGLSALARIADRVQMRWGIYAILGIAVSISVLGYTPKRLAPLAGFGNITRQPIETVQQMRYTPDTPVQVIVSGPHHWREFATFMAITDPYATNSIIGLRDPDQSYAQGLMDRYPDRQVIFMVNEQLIPVDIRGRAGYDEEPEPVG